MTTKRFAKPLPIFLATLLIALLTIEAERFNTSYLDPFNFTCPDNHTIYRLFSQYGEQEVDRQWVLDCRPEGASATHCTWSDYVNIWNEDYSYNCPNHHIIAGIQSFHCTNFEDRQFQFYCCAHSNLVTTSCEWTDFLNDLNGNLEYSVQARKALVGVSSEHNVNRQAAWLSGLHVGLVIRRERVRFPATTHGVIALRKQFVHISSVHPPIKWIRD
ncbi:hemagglutinin/amebocyte aggregation factor-like [Elysia marginata]|uniref:Hemagglutinin/amebocyte aggregation factor-like n=1 Tax=Elysia marginata TaxID=1093978 RepID=A0AAV4I2N5_9GAST|nr:hemagglutinin/amebocyte aggregation factor-like [Elysia marginata]